MAEAPKAMTHSEAIEYVKNGGDPLDTTPARQRELHDHFERQKKIESGEIAAEMARDAAMGSENNPIKGPPHPGFDGPQVNFSPPARDVAAGRAAPLGSRAMPLVGPPLGSSPGVKNPGSAAGFKRTEPGKDVPEALEQQARREAEIRLRGNAAPGNTRTADDQYIDDGQGYKFTPREGESRDDAIARHKKEREQASGAG